MSPWSCLLRVFIATVLLPYRYQGVRALDPLSNYALSGFKHNYKPVSVSDPAEIYKSWTLDVPIDHFLNDSKYEPHNVSTFKLRYWFDPTYYQYGGPVILLQGGEGNATYMLPALQKGIGHKLAKITGGMVVLLEHRFYGESQPMEDLSVKSYRFLDTQQAMADTVYFAKNIKFPGYEWMDLGPDKTAWIAYGASYPGAFVAMLRVIYPKVFWGAISSSGVPQAIVDYWQYWEAVRRYGPSKCIIKAQHFFEVMDSIFFLDPVSNPGKPGLVSKFKSLFGLEDVNLDENFADVISNTGIGAWQSRNWDPEIGSLTFDHWCNNISSPELLYPASEEKRQDLLDLLTEVPQLGQPEPYFVNSTLNWIGYINATAIAECHKRNMSIANCFALNETFWQDESHAQAEMRSWPWQVCTQWGYLASAGSTPSSIRPVRSRLLTLDYEETLCRVAFNRTIKDIHVESINQYGGFSIGMDVPRLAFIDGQADPWLYAGTHANEAPERKDWITTPWVSLENAVHHWEENGLFKNSTTQVPENIRNAWEYEQWFVKTWVDDYNIRCRRYREC